MKRVNVIFDLIILGISIFFFYESFSLPDGTGSPGTNPAIYPQVILISVIILVLIDLISIYAEQNKEKFLSKFEKRQLKRLLAVGFSIVVFIILFKNIPFILLAFGLIFIQCLVLKLRPVTSIITALTISVSVYTLFVYGLNIIL